MVEDFTNTSDVTIASEVGGYKTLPTVCNFNQKGFCKFGQTCCNVHIDTTCKVTNCDIALRHPKTCKYFSQKRHCKRGLFGAYSHNKSDKFVKVEDIESEVNLLMSEIKTLKHNILKVKIFWSEHK